MEAVIEIQIPRPDAPTGDAPDQEAELVIDAFVQRVENGDPPEAIPFRMNNFASLRPTLVSAVTALRANATFNNVSVTTDGVQVAVEAHEANGIENVYKITLSK